MDKVIDKIAALGVPGLVLLVAISLTGLAGGAAIVAALAMLGGPFGMLGGIAVLGILTLISKAIADYGVAAIFKGVVSRLNAQGISKGEIRSRVNSYPISKSLKRTLFEHLDHL
jgi:uncharacterized membrane protein